MHVLNDFPKAGVCNLGPVLDVDQCRDALAKIHATRNFSGDLFLTEDAYRANPQHKGVNPENGRNLIETIDVDFIEQNPAVVDALTKVLGEGYRVLFKKFVCGVPESWMPEWLLEETKNLAVANLGAYIKPEYRDITYFHGIDFHQDIIDYQNRLSDFITLYVYLEDTTPDTSPLYVIPNTHEFGATTFPHDINYIDSTHITYSDRKGQIGNYTIEMLLGGAGSVNFWHACSLHGTKPHMSSLPRISVRYLIEKVGDNPNCLLSELNNSISGSLDLATTRVDLNEKGEAILKGNIINKQSNP